MKRNVENLKGDLLSAAGEFRLLVHAVSPPRDGQVEVKLTPKEGVTIARVRLAALRTAECLESLGWDVAWVRLPLGKTEVSAPEFDPMPVIAINVEV